jgi:MFS family permease
MIRSFGEVDEDDIAFYASLLISSYTFCEFLSGMIWAKISDRIGRKFTLLIGSFCGMIAALVLGFSQSMALAIASRVFGGLFNPNVGLVQTCVVELAHKDQQGRAPGSSTISRGDC